VIVAGSPNRRAVRELVEWVLLPGLAMLLPWQLCFPLYRWLAGWQRLYWAETRAAMDAAAGFGLVHDPVAWGRAYRLMRLVDHADLYLSRFRGDGWMRRHVALRSGAWPTDQGPFLAITFHWGSGLWGLRHMRAGGRSCAVLVRDIPIEQFVGRPVLAWYAALRTRETARAGGGGVIYASSSSLTRIRRQFRGGGNIVALLDVPPEPGQKSLTCEFFGRPAAFPRGLMHLAVSEKMPVVVYDVTLARDTGKRVLNMENLGSFSDERALLTVLVSRLETLVRSDPASWHHWPGIGTFHQRAGIAGSKPGDD
jgi:phosphatidylinositol dimannoside acyltransferase